MKLRPLVLGSIVALSLAGAAIAQQQPDWNAIQVTAQPIRPGVAVLFGNGGNIGVSYGSDGTLIVDDQFAPLVPKIQAAIAGLGASPVKFLVNTHWHFDHAQGNENFGKAGALIVAQTRVRDRLAAGGAVAGNTAPPAPAAALPPVPAARCCRPRSHPPRAGRARGSAQRSARRPGRSSRSRPRGRSASGC